MLNFTKLQDNFSKSSIDLFGEEEKREVRNCAGEISGCPVNHQFQKWSKWTECPTCFQQGYPNVERKRSRYCVNGRNGGSMCPAEVR